jgi:class 3 adenylate cyclase
VTVLFADVVHSMDIAAAVGAERLREIMTELVDRSTAVVRRYGGMVDKFTGEGIMAVFGPRDVLGQSRTLEVGQHQLERDPGRRPPVTRRPLNSKRDYIVGGTGTTLAVYTC